MKQYRPIDWIWFGLIVLTLAFLALRGSAPWLITFPVDWVIPVTDWLNLFMDWSVEHFGTTFRAFSAALDVPMSAVRDLLNWLPWSVTLTLLTFASFAVSGWRLALFTFLAILYMVVIGYWSESMNSLALVAISVPMAVSIGFTLGTLAFYSQRAKRVITPLMDLLQTVPAFAYLLPILILFGFGPVVGLIASVLYAFPPTVRNTMLGLARVPQEVIEAGLMSGATPGQLFWRVRTPSAMKQILLGVNQTTMAAFSMVIIASIIGGTADIGWEVLSTMRKALFGESLLAGIVIALMAMVMDRITAAAAVAAAEPAGTEISPYFLVRHRRLAIAATLGLGVAVLVQIIPFLGAYPEAWEVYPAHYMNDALTYLVVEYADTINLIKTWAFFFVMLPVKVGFEQTISPYSWGFEFSSTLKILYAVVAVALTVWIALKHGLSRAALVAFCTVLLFFGLTRLPWPTLVAMMTLLGWQIGGARLALGTLAGLSFLLLTGIWPQTLLSIYLCGLAVLLSFSIGTVLGVLAAEIDGVSSFLRPINDTLQTMPLFVILIPFVMIFKIGEFTALLAIMAYAVVPAIRYAEHGLRSVSEQVVEAATATGCTRRQLLWRVKFPLALPVMMLGLNQTIMFGIAMLVIAALVGTNGLGQRVYIGLGNGDFGFGMVAGIGMAIIAITADRFTQAWSKKRQVELGLDADF
ncbi:MAG: glycine/betaine ABC transporter permease [Gammaproteobacteria bacterium]|nr:MAG: glycine/betaine ABC transporter permease [Gammaproteobacteria bacterium]